MKKIVWIIAILGLTAVVGGTIFGIRKANSDKATLADIGMVLRGEGTGEGKTVEVNAGTEYNVTKGGTVKLKDADGKTQILPSRSFAVLDKGSVVAFDDGILLNFKDISENFINNYLVPSGMEIEKTGDGYMASTTNGSIAFGDHIWKLADNKYLIRSPELTVHFADGDDRQVKEFVQVFVSDDGIVHILTPENEWTTISEGCYIQTEDGTIVRPLLQRVERGDFKLSLSGLSVTSEDNIELTEDLLRRQIVPELKITTADGEDGKSGTNGTSGEDGASGTDGRNGENGQDGTDGEDGAEGTAGTAGNSGSSGNTGAQGTKGANGVNGIDAADGTPGIAGITGNAGALGEEGEEGNKGGSGTDGNNGTNGNKGTSGNLGTDGKDGIDGGDGEEGEEGNKGETGGSGTKGSDAASITTVNSQLPAMSFGQITITDTTISGSILIDDPSKMLANLYVDPTEVDKFKAAEKSYPGEVIITNKATGEQIVVYPYKGKDQAIDDQSNFYKYFSVQNSTGHTVYFGINPQDPQMVNESKYLSPNTEYLIEVTAYYSSQTSGESKSAFKRTFLSRTFYTDSAGVTLTKDRVYMNPAGENEAELNVILQSNMDKSKLSAEVYLLTPDQNSEFSLSTKSSADAFLYRYTLDYANNTYTGKQGSYVYQQADGTQVRVMVGDDTTGQTITDPTQQKLLFVPVAGGEDSGMPLSGNTEYIARVVINNNGVETLSPQIVSFHTLKAVPYTQKHQPKQGGGLEIVDLPIRDSVPSVNFNRVSGAFEVSKPIVVDTDSSITGYVYKAYLNGSNEPCATKEVSIGAIDPIEFFLPTGSENSYEFRIEFKTDNGETEVLYETSKSVPVQGLGSTLPALTFEGETTFNSVAGKFTMSMGSGTGIKVDNQHPLWLEIYGDEKYENSILYEGESDSHGKRSGTGACSNADVATGKCLVNPCGPETTCGCDWWISTNKMYTINSSTIQTQTTTGLAGVNTNNIQFSLALKDLYENHKYTVKVSGYARLTENGNMGVDEGSGYVFTELGSFTFRTKQPQALTMRFTDKKGTTSKLNLTVKMSSSNEYEISEIQKGQVVIQLYDGAGTKGTVLGTKYVTEPAELQALTGANGAEGLELLDTSFGQVKLKDGATYTVSVTQVSDETYDLDTTSNGVNDYTNYFNSIENRTKIVAAKASPPDLTDNPQIAVVVKEIKNKDAALLGYTKDPKLSDDAVIGYTLRNTYQNDSHLGYKIKYYAFEYNDFYNCLKGDAENPGKDPVGYYLQSGEDISDSVGIRKLVTLTRNFDRMGTSVPNVAVIFDPNATEPTADADAKSYSYDNTSFYVYRINPLKTVTTTEEVEGEQKTVKYKQGMSRGYRYVFAYTMEYSSPDAVDEVGIYPYDHDKYTDYMNDYGIGYEGSERRFRGVAYILNSGMRNAPKDAPVINTYVSAAYPTFTPADDLDASVSQGVATLNYTYRDPDQALIPGNSNIMYKNKQAAAGGGWVEVDATAKLEKVTPDATTGNVDWKSVNLGFVSTRKFNTAELDQIHPRAKCSLYTDSDPSDKKGPYDDVLEAYGYDKDSQDIAFGTVAVDYDWDGYMAKYNENGVQAPRVSVKSHASENYIDLAFDMESEKTKLIVQRAYGAVVYARKKDPANPNAEWPVEIQKPMLGDGITSTYVRIGTGELADIGTGAIEFKVNVLYDNGDSGWDLAARRDSDPKLSGFGIYLSKVENNGMLSRGGYYVLSDTLSYQPFGGLFETQYGKNIPDFEKMVNTKTRQDTGYAYRFNTSPLRKYIYPFADGVDGSGNGKTLGKPDGYVLMPKSVGIIATAMDGDGSAEVEVILPTLYYQNYESWTTSVYFRAGDTTMDMHLAGQQTAVAYNKGQITSGTPDSLSQNFYIVHCGLFDDQHKDDAKKDENLYDKTHGWYVDKHGNDRVIHLVFDESGILWGTCQMDGNPTYPQLHDFVQTERVDDAWTNLPVINDLNEEELKVQNYFATFFMDFEKGGNYYRRILIDAENSATSSPKSSYEVGTSKGVTVEIDKNEAQYRSNNKSYFEKEASIIFGLSPRAYGINMMYDIYETNEQASTDERDPNSYIDLNNEVIKSYIFEANSPLTNTDNYVRINLSPDKILELNRRLAALTPPADPIRNLQPGRTYWLRATAYNSGNQQGYSVVPIQVKKSTFGASIGMADRTQDKITFTVTVSDEEHLAMGFKPDLTEGQVKSMDPDPKLPGYNKMGLYAVRFTDANGKRITTKYDDYVFSFEDLAQEFILGETSALQPDTEYFCNVFAVMDTDLDGLSASVTGEPYDSTTMKDWSYFFADVWKNKSEDSTINGWKAKPFTDLINSLWDNNGNKKFGSDDVKINNIYNAFLVESRSRRTTPAIGGINIPAGKDYLEAGTGQFVFYVKESYGVVTLDDQQQPVQGFDTIEWSIQSGLGKRYTGFASKADGDDMFVPEFSGDALNGTFKYYLDLDGDKVYPNVEYEISIKLVREATASLDRVEKTFSYVYLKEE